VAICVTAVIPSSCRSSIWPGPEATREALIALHQDVRGRVLAGDLARADGFAYAVDVGELMRVASRLGDREMYAALRGFGDPRTGESPHSDWPAFDIVAQAMGGFAHVNGPRGDDDRPGGGYPGGASVGDLFPGTLMALGVVAGVHHARRTGEGQFMDVAMVDGVNLLCESVFANYGSSLRHQLPPRGKHHHSLSPFGIYDAKDGGVAIAAPTPAQWEILCQEMGRPDLVEDERTKNFWSRRENREFVEAVVSKWTGAHTRDEIVEALAGRVPCGPVQTAADIFESPHTAIREMVAEVELPGENAPVKIVGCPIKYTETKTGVRRRAPLLDEHRDEILAQFGLDQDGQPKE